MYFVLGVVGLIFMNIASSTWAKATYAAIDLRILGAATFEKKSFRVVRFISCLKSFVFFRDSYEKL